MNSLTKKLALAFATILFGLGTMVGTSSAAQPPCYQYNANGFQTSQTPVFNDICGVPGVGNESDFVRIRQSSNGNDEDFTNNPQFQASTLTAACNAGDKFDIWNYLHNDAESQYNDNGSGSSVAHNVQSLLSAPLGSTASKFKFSDTVSASNANTVSDSVDLDCNGKTVTLNLVPSTVHIYYMNSNSWANLSDSTINHETALGSPTPGSGDMWGCWNYRMIVVYQVTVSTPPAAPQVTAKCNLLTVLANSDRTVTVNSFNYTATNASFQQAVINWGDTPNDSDNTTLTNANSVIGQTHQFTGNGPYEISALVSFTSPYEQNVPSSGGPGTICSEEVSFTSSGTPVITPPSTTVTTSSTPPASTTTTELVNTGPGSVLGIFAATTAAGAAAYRWLLARRLSRN